MLRLRRFHRLGVLLFCLAFFSSVGGHWVILQSVAWARMLRTYSRSESIRSATLKTFDGKHPCEMCRKIVRAHTQEKHKTTVLNSLKAKFRYPAPAALPRLFAGDASQAPLARGLGCGFLRMRPPTPPPRA